MGRGLPSSQGAKAFVRRMSQERLESEAYRLGVGCGATDVASLCQEILVDEKRLLHMAAVTISIHPQQPAGRVARSVCRRNMVGRRFGAAQSRTVTEIRRYQLEKLGIAPSDEEMDLHDRISTLSFGNEADLQPRCARWLDRLAQHNASAGIYPQEAFADRLRVLKVSARWRRGNLLRRAWRRAW